MSLATHLPRRRFTAHDVDRMLEAGVLDEDEPLELLDGELCLMSPQNPRHAATAAGMHQLFATLYGPGVTARSHSPLALGDESLPEPDVAVVHGPSDRHFDRHPSGLEAILVVEISETSRRRDRDKAALYARGGVPVYWLLDLEERRLEVRHEPRSGEYTRVQILGEDATVELPGLDRRLTVAELLPPR